MRKIKTIILSIAVICIFCGILVIIGMKQKVVSPQGDEEPVSEYSLRATIIEIKGEHLLVEPLAEEWERRSSERISLSGDIKGDKEAEAGDTVIIYYDGMILESYPAQLREVYSIELEEF